MIRERPGSAPDPRVSVWLRTLSRVTLIATQSLTKRYNGRVTALADLTVSVEPGIVGPGRRQRRRQVHADQDPARAAAADQRAGAGARPRPDHRTATQVRARVGYMPEHDCLPPDLSAAEFVTHLAG